MRPNTPQGHSGWHRFAAFGPPGAKLGPQKGPQGPICCQIWNGFRSIATKCQLRESKWAQKRSKWLKMAQNRPNMAQSRVKMAQIGSKWPQMAQNGPKWPKMAQNGPKMGFGRLGGGTPFWGPKLPCWPAGDQVEAKNGSK